MPSDDIRTAVGTRDLDMFARLVDRAIHEIAECGNVRIFRLDPERIAGLQRLVDLLCITRHALQLARLGVLDPQMPDTNALSICASIIGSKRSVIF